MKKFVLKSLFAASLAVILLSGCKKEKTEDMDTDTSGAEDNAYAENTSSDIISIGSQASDDGSNSLNNFRIGAASSILSSCAAVTRDTATHTVTVTFNGSPCIDGRTRSGVLTFNYSASVNGAKHYRDPGFSCTVTSNAYVVDGNQVNIINKTITNTTHGGNPVGYDPSDSSTPETWHITADISITRTTGTILNWNCDRTKTLLNTSTVCPASDFVNFPASDTIPINWSQARVGITGNASGNRTFSSSTETFTVTITSQLVRDFGACPSLGGRHPFIMGTMDRTSSARPIRHLDFGSDANGNINNGCDLYVLITFTTVNGNPHSVVRSL